MDMETLRANWSNTISHDGGKCAVCDRWGKVYKRNINKTMAKGLIWLYQNKGEVDGWVHIPTKAPKWLTASNQLATLHWWNLVERKSKDESHKAKFSGIWRTTPLGDAFVTAQRTMPKSVFTYNNTVIRFGTKEAYIYECFKERFDYDQIMGDSLYGSDS